MRMLAIEEEREVLVVQMDEPGQLAYELFRIDAAQADELEQQISKIRSAIATLDREMETLSTQTEPVEWDLLCLDEVGGRALVISRQCVVQRPFDTVGSRNWQSSGLRSWLNGEFLESQPDCVRIRVLETPIDEVKDRVFLLSKEEVRDYFTSDSQRVATYLGKPTWWWLRTPGYHQYGVASVDSDGRVYDYGMDITFDGGVRPVLWLDLNT
ncbi:MAG: DUF6273 domain-containing protein [Propionibacteriaceae bacterium]|nr:DUF6273 domain-containing protein [Propionibacteriaceae bacterium]